MTPDATLFEAWRGGDRIAGDELFRRHFDGVFRFFRNKTDDAVAEELTQVTFTALVDATNRFEGRSSFRTFVFAVARNQLLMYLRKQYTEAKLFDPGSVSVADLDRSPSQWAVAREEQALLLRALRRLPLDHQIALELHYWEGMSTPEVARVLDVAVGTVRSRLTRAREKLTTIIEQLAKNPALAQSTLSGLDDWARALKDE